MDALSVLTHRAHRLTDIVAAAAVEEVKVVVKIRAVPIEVQSAGVVLVVRRR